MAMHVHRNHHNHSNHTLYTFPNGTVTQLLINGTDPDASDDDYDPNGWLYNAASQAGAGAAIILCTIVLIAFCLIHRYQIGLFKRVSFKLVLVGTCCDLGYAIGVLLSALPTGYDDDKLCAASMFIQDAFLLGSLSCTASIGLNLLLVFVIKVRGDKPFEKIYYSASLFIAVTVPLIALSLGRYGWDGTECWYSADDSDQASVANAFMWEWLTYYGWVLLVCVFCLVCTVAFHFSITPPASIASKAEVADSVTGVGQGVKEASNKAFRNTDRLIRRAVGRIRWYCLVPIVAHIWSLASDTHAYITGDIPTWLWVMANFMSGFMGALNSTVFLVLDPSFAAARSKFRVHLVYKYYLRHFKVSASSQSVPKMTSLDRSVDALQSLRQLTADVLHAEAGTSVLIPRQIVPTGPMFHFVRLLLLREEDVIRFANNARLLNLGTSTRKGAGDTTSTVHLQLLRHAVDHSTSTGGQDRVLAALQDSAIAGSTVDDAADQLNRL
ncbi:hypothetical protein HKX48_008493 [Thoreauomyces humboldtii]|nr:hypothetical protein HKX48_008493 [Thoreauomyces humboldtii]